MAAAPLQAAYNPPPGATSVTVLDVHYAGAVTCSADPAVQAARMRHQLEKVTDKVPRYTCTACTARAHKRCSLVTRWSEVWGGVHFGWVLVANEVMLSLVRSAMAARVCVVRPALPLELAGRCHVSRLPVRAKPVAAG